jgi:hypothetical protein
VILRSSSCIEKLGMRGFTMGQMRCIVWWLLASLFEILTMEFRGLRRQPVC